MISMFNASSHLLKVNGVLKHIATKRCASFASCPPFRQFVIYWFALLLLILPGCVAHSASPTTRLATDIDPLQAEPAYWLAQPVATSVKTLDFDALFQAAQKSAQDYRFKLDRLDYRAGLITTTPLVSKQWFEVWRKEVIGFHDQQIASTATLRRTVRFEIARREDGRYELSPQVLVERQAIAGGRVTTVVHSARALSPSGSGSIEADAGIVLPTNYWYAVGRDENLERALARQIEKRLSGS